ncbi:MAG: cell division protein ZipA C-terminal FtsZ-binding domain-containing protein [Gammaproteobacteria bacterium]|nr:cell division protein ZipA C-terminal FtsZ-binding domain-containing protein [Gammaproteobacteria bacterium]
MAELRWVLLGLGVLVVVGIYLWGRGVFRRNRLERAAARRRAEPHISSAPEFGEDDRLILPQAEDTETAAVAESVEPVEPAQSAAEAPEKQPQVPEKIVTIRFIPKAGEIGGEEAVQALRGAGLAHGRYGIFHLHDEGSGDELFSVASLTEPGTFDLTQLATSPIAGMSFFIVLPGTGDPVSRFDAMVQAARMLAIELDAELFDDRGSSWSIQRERYVREEIIRYRHQLMQTEVAGNARG